MAKDVQNQQMAEWLQQLGCPIELSPEDLQNLNTGSMPSVWRHLQRHVKPKNTVAIIKKNLLLARLRTDGLLLGKFGDFKIETVQELEQMQKHSDTQKEIDLVKAKIREVDESLLYANQSLITKVTEKKLLMKHLDELHEKTTILNLKLSCVQSDIEKLDKELEIASVVNKCPTANMSYLEVNENKQMVAKFLQKLSSVEIIDDCISEMIVATSEVPPSVILNGVLSVSYNALKALNSYKIDDVSNMLSGNLSFSKHLTILNTTLFKHEVEHQNCSRKMVACKVELYKERDALCKVIEEVVTPGNGNSNLVELIDKIIDTTLIIKREEKLRGLLNELEDVCSSDYDHVQWLVKSCKEEEYKLLTEVNNKISNSNKLLEKISTINLSYVKAEVVHRIRDLVSKFLTQLKNHKEEENRCQVFVSENLIGKEIEMFMNLPLVAMTRQWEDSSETVQLIVTKDVLNSPKSFRFLCQSEPKDLIKNIVEKIFWLHTINQPFSE